MAEMTVPNTGKPFIQQPTLAVPSATKSGLYGRLFYAFVSMVHASPSCCQPDHNQSHRALSPGNIGVGIESISL